MHSRGKKIIILSHFSMTQSALLNCPMWLTPLSSPSLPFQLAWWQVHKRESITNPFISPVSVSQSVPSHFSPITPLIYYPSSTSPFYPIFFFLPHLDFHHLLWTGSFPLPPASLQQSDRLRKNRGSTSNCVDYSNPTYRYTMHNHGQL